MTNLISNIKNLFSPVEPLEPGIYQYLSPPDDPRNYRLHLRIEPDANGILILNASTILHLNQTATEYAYHLVHNHSPENAAHEISRRYKIEENQAKNDYLQFSETLQTLINSPDLDPVSFLGIDRILPFTGRITAPYRLDCAITYSLPETESSDAAPVDRAEQELNTDQWKQIIDKAWRVGIPHVVFTGGEPTLRKDLPEILWKAEENGQVSGLLTNGLAFADTAYLDDLLQTGLDHAMLIYQPGNEIFKKALENVLAEDLFVAVHLTLDESNEIDLINMIPKMRSDGVKAVSLSTHDLSLVAQLNSIRELAAEQQLELIWNLPVPYSSTNPVDLETDKIETQHGEGKAWLYVEPDGDVLPAQGINQVLGNFLHDDWGVIWKA